MFQNQCCARLDVGALQGQADGGGTGVARLLTQIARMNGGKGQRSLPYVLHWSIGSGQVMI
jgi:hypothetical protein